MKHPIRQRPLISKPGTPPDEQGIVMVISLLMGVILITGATGLLIRQLTAKKLSASESYQQLAETAASNGFNRILAVLNNASTAEYRGFLFTENNEPTTWNWDTVYSKGQYCSGAAGLPEYADAAGENTSPWPASAVGYALNEQNLRGDGKGTIQSSYRLRSYTSTFSEGQGTGTFEVEGFVRRQDPEDGTDVILARARLTRSLQLESAIARADDWGVVASQASNVLNNNDDNTITIDGPGRFVWYTSTPNTTFCSQTYRNVSGDSTQVVWPLLRDNNTQYIPEASTYNRDGTVDQIQLGETKYNRVWSFDDTGSGLSCGGQQSIVCTRPGGTGRETVPDLASIQANAFGQGGDQSEDMEYKTFYRNTRDNYFQIGTCTDKINPEVNCRSEDIYKGNWSWSNRKYYYYRIPGSSITRWRKTNSGKQIGTCKRQNAYDCNFSKSWHWRWKDVVEESTEKSTDRNIIKIDSNNICKDESSSNVCHLFIEHLNLTNTDLYIKNDTRAIVLHLNLAQGVARRSDLVNYTYNLGTNARICGVNSLADIGTNRRPECNLQPAQFVLTQTGDSEKGSCPTNPDRDDFVFEGESLPAAWLSMDTGRIRPGEAQLRGVIWASAVCPNGDTTVITQNNDGIAYVDQAKTYWGFPASGGIGRRIVRGIRGSGFDIFKRW
ncbi:hypothetical protein [Synechococcus sp. MIT S1220]|uniref:hypothetical protein n=1 Tax=Synechococcus sp. MIT S1220 TaxID=3082549 RepID=UPI0039AF3B93